MIGNSNLNEGVDDWSNVFGNVRPRQLVRVVKETDSKSVGLCPRKFESCSCRFFVNSLFNPISLYSITDIPITFFFLFLFSHPLSSPLPLLSLCFIYQTIHIKQPFISFPSLFLLHLHSFFFLLLLFLHNLLFSCSFFFHRNAVLQFLQLLNDRLALLLQHFQRLFLTPVLFSSLEEPATSQTRSPSTPQRRWNHFGSLPAAPSPDSPEGEYTLGTFYLAQSHHPYVQFRSCATCSVFSPPRSSISKTPIGHVCFIRSASSPTSGLGNRIDGRMR